MTRPRRTGEAARAARAVLAGGTAPAVDPELARAFDLLGYHLLHPGVVKFIDRGQVRDAHRRRRGVSNDPSDLDAALALVMAALDDAQGPEPFVPPSIAEPTPRGVLFEDEEAA